LFNVLFPLLPVGSVAPDFTLPDAMGTMVTLSALLAMQQAVILIFYPGNFTPVCTAQLCEMNQALQVQPDAYNKLSNGLGVVVLGINPAKASSHKQFSDKYHLSFPLLVDAYATVAKQYKAILIPGLVNNRVVYGIAPDGIIRFAQLGKPNANTVIETLRPFCITSSI
jgi:thioredoxin-dependent peroxiredoxin